ncbi:hypothetical protein ACN71_05910 [Escherichia coli]|nr:hypothetical protein ACN71_05910 [Escherichia coli]
MKSVISKEVTDFLFVGWGGENPIFGGEGKLLIINGCASCRTPVGASHPPWSAICEKKARTFVRALL